MIVTMQITTTGVRSTLLLAICLVVATGCVYQMPIQQGNFIDATSLVQVKKGMTRAQVRYLLGTPMVPGGFDNDRWDYDYYLKLQHLDAPRRARAAVYFHSDVVDHVDSDVMPVANDMATRGISAPDPAAVPVPGAAPVEPPVAAPATAPARVPDAAPNTAPVGSPGSPPAS
jgi:outer membrane protein assembly factor BamE